MKIPPETESDLSVFLTKSGYRYYTPSCRTWRSAFVLKKEDSVLSILVRKNGVDFRLYETYVDGITVTNKINIAFTGGKLFRNHYNESKKMIIRKAWRVSGNFSRGNLSKEITVEEGRSYLLNPEYKKVRADSLNRFRARRSALISKKIERIEKEDHSFALRAIEIGDGDYG